MNRRRWIAIAVLVSLAVATSAAAQDEVLRSSTRLPFDPRAEVAEQLSNPLLWKSIFEQLERLRTCAVDKRGVEALPGAAETESDPRKLAARLGLDLASAETADLIRATAFGEMLRDRQREYQYLCGEPLPPELLLDQFGCRRACNLSWEACFSDCQSVGPPSPSCLSHCDRLNFWCSVVCAFY